MTMIDCIHNFRQIREYISFTMQIQNLMTPSIWELDFQKNFRVKSV